MVELINELKEDILEETREASQTGNLGSISGVKYNDLSGNGIREPNEPGLPEVTIYLDVNNNNSLDPDEPGSITDFDGNYLFSDVPPGVYPVREVPQSGFTQTTGDRIISLNGENFENINIGNTQASLGGIAGIKYNDLNGNGQLEPGEPGLPNFTIYLDANDNSRRDEGEPRTITDAGGNYFLRDIPSGNYFLREEQQLGFVQSTEDRFIILNGENFTNINIGNTQPSLGGIAGIKYNDLNGNGQLEPGEPGLPNFSIYLDANNNSRRDEGEPRSITDAGGNYSLRDIPSGNYFLREEQQLGFVQTTEDRFIILNGENFENINVGNASTRGSIAGTKYNDLNANGEREEGEPGLGNFTVYLDLNNNDILEADEPRTITDSQGNYSFQDLPSSIFVVREEQQFGFTQTTPPRVINLNGQNFTGIDIGNARPIGGISGVKYNDFNTNGVREAGEPGIEGVTVYLDNNNNRSLDPGEASTVSDSLGNYAFTDLAAGTYPVREVLPGGFTQTTRDRFITVNGDSFDNIDIGNVRSLGSIRGVKFNDLNGNGVLDSGEPGLSGFSIYLDINNNEVIDPEEPVSITDPTGNYFFNDLPGGTYIVREVQQPGFVQTSIVPIITIDPDNNLSNVAVFGNFDTLTRPLPAERTIDGTTVVFASGSTDGQVAIAPEAVEQIAVFDGTTAVEDLLTGSSSGGGEPSFGLNALADEAIALASDTGEVAIV
ncbi:MAG: SdrD B-like domain-containing protein [Cyanobacteriota bacterium]|nr:SdrD B-like domain-containing protein [Cyanobacteriota bacterium]